MAWRNDFQYGNWGLGFLLTARLGGVVYSATQAVLDSYGVSEATAAARDNGGVVINGNDMIDAQKWYTVLVPTAVFLNITLIVLPIYVCKKLLSATLSQERN